MIDTIRIESPALSPFEVSQIEARLVSKMAVDNRTGEQLYKFTSDSLKGSYDSRIQVAIKDRSMGEKVLIIEGSVHKNLLGQNAVGMIEDFRLCACWFVSLIQEQFNVSLPSWKIWKPKRIDFAKVFDLGSSENVKKYLKGLSDLTFPRRQVLPYGHTGLAFYGSTTGIKLYHKGIEFKKHDYKRLKQFFSIEKMTFFYEVVQRLLRVEVGVLSRKIKERYGNTVTCEMVESNWLRDVWTLEVGKLLKEGDSMRIVRTCDLVQERLFNVYGKRLASVLYGTWFMLTTQGEENVKNRFAESTYRRQIKQLKDAGVSWHNTDINVDSGLIEFKPSLDSDKLINWVHEDCYKLLQRKQIA